MKLGALPQRAPRGHLSKSTPRPHWLSWAANTGQHSHWRGARVARATGDAEPSVASTATDDAPASSSAPRPLAGVPPVAEDPTIPEELFYEGNGGALELALNLVLGLTLIWAPLTISAIGRRLWIKYRFTNKRLSVINTSPLFARQVDVAYSQIKEIRAAPRAFGAWGDMVIFLKDGARLEIIGLERFQDIKRYIESCIVD